MRLPQVLAFVRERLVYVWIVSVGLWLSWWGWLLLTSLGVLVDADRVYTDHMAFYSGARLIAEGRGEVMYDYEKLGYEQRRFIGIDDGEFGPLTAIRNPPFYFLIYLPTCRLPYLASFWVWSLLSLLMLQLGLRLLHAPRPWRAMAWAVSFYPVFTTISFGQNTLLSFGVLAAVYARLRAGGQLTAGMLAGLLGFKPTLLVGLVVWWLIDLPRYWRCLLGVAATGLILLAVTLLAVPREFEAFLANLGPIAAYDRDEFFNHHTLRAFWGYLFGNDKALGLRLGGACSLVILLAFAWFVRRGRRAGAGPARDLPALFGAAVAVTLMASPHALVYEWSLLLIPAVLWWEAFPENRDRWLLLYAGAWLTLLTGTQATKYQAEWLGDHALHYSPPLLTLLGFLAGRELLRLQKPPTPR